MNITKNTWIGEGISFPNPLDPVTGGITSNTDVQRINQSIRNILSTHIGERFFNPEFGSNLRSLIFEQNDLIFQDLAQVYIKQALGRWEPRIEVLTISVGVFDYDNEVPIDIVYKITNTNMVHNYVYPFRREGTPIIG